MDETALPRATRATRGSPDEDAPRLAFADGLTERGDAVGTAWAAEPFRVSHGE